MSLMCYTHECLCTSYYHVLHCIDRNLIPKRAQARNPKTTPSLIRYQHTSDEKSDLADIYMTALNICIPRDWSKKIERLFCARSSAELQTCNARSSAKLPPCAVRSSARLPPCTARTSAIINKAFDFS